MSNENNEQNATMEMPQNNEEVKMEVPSAADQINQSNNVLPQQQEVQYNMNQNYAQQPVNNGGMNSVVAAAKKMDVKAIVAVCAVAFIVFIVILVLLFGGGSKGVVKKFSKYYVKGDYKKIVTVYHDDFMDEYSKDFKGMIKDDFKEREDDDIKYKGYKILDKFTFSKDQLEKLADNLEDKYDIDEDDVKGAVQYLVKFKVDNDGEKAVDYQTIMTVKVKGKWYIFSVPYSYF